jgi:hypothetical protein
MGKVEDMSRSSFWEYLRVGSATWWTVVICIIIGPDSVALSAICILFCSCTLWWSLNNPPPDKNKEPAFEGFPFRHPSSIKDYS